MQLQKIIIQYSMSTNINRYLNSLIIQINYNCLVHELFNLSRPQKIRYGQIKKVLDNRSVKDSHQDNANGNN